MQETTSQSLQTLMQKLQKPQEEKQTTPMVQLVVFEIDGEKYAVEITDLKEIIVSAEITPLPNSPEYVKGILNLRGRIVAVIDLLQRIHLPGYQPPESRKKILICEVENDLYGIEIDNVLKIELVEITAIKPTPTVILNKIKNDQCIKGVVLLNEKENDSEHKDDETEIIIIFDLNKLITNN